MSDLNKPRPLNYNHHPHHQQKQLHQQQQEQDAYEDLEQYEKMNDSQSTTSTETPLPPTTATQPKYNGRRRNTNDALPTPKITSHRASQEPSHHHNNNTNSEMSQIASQRQQQPPSTLIAMHNLGQHQQKQQQCHLEYSPECCYVGIDEYRNPLYSKEEDTGNINKIRTNTASATRRPTTTTGYGGGSSNKHGEVSCNVPYTIPSRYRENHPSLYSNKSSSPSASSQKKKNLLYESTTTTELLQQSRIDGVGPNNNKISITKQNSTSTLTVCQEQDDEGWRLILLINIGCICLWLLSNIIAYVFYCQCFHYLQFFNKSLKTHSFISIK